MSRSYRALVRVFGGTIGVDALRLECLLSEAKMPSHEFTLKPLSFWDTSGEVRGFTIYGETSNREPNFAQLAFAELTATHPSTMVELVVDDSDIEIVTVFQSGKLVYQARREEVTGDVYELGQQGVKYFYGQEVGERNVFLTNLASVGITRHQVKPL